MFNKKLFLISLIILVFISLSAINAADINDTSIQEENIIQQNMPSQQSTPIQQDTTIKQETINQTLQNDDKLKSEETENPIKSINKTTQKSTKQANAVVSNYTELYNILTDENANNNITISLEGNDKTYVVTNPINVSKSIKNLVIEGNDKIINGIHQYSFLRYSGTNLTINNLSFVNCYNNTDGAAVITSNATSLIINNSKFMGNYRELFYEGSELMFMYGGIISFRGKKLLINNSTFSENKIHTQNANLSGGIIYVSYNLNNPLIVSNSTFDSNIVECVNGNINGALVYVNDDYDNKTFINNTFRGNKITGSGNQIKGGLMYFILQSTEYLGILDSYYYENKITSTTSENIQGALVYIDSNQDTSVVVSGSHFEHNQINETNNNVDLSGSILYIRSSNNVLISNSSISNNKLYGANLKITGGFLHINSNYGLLTINNSDLSYNTVTQTITEELTFNYDDLMEGCVLYNGYNDLNLTKTNFLHNSINIELEALPDDSTNRLWFNGGVLNLDNVNLNITDSNFRDNEFSFTHNAEGESEIIVSGGVIYLSRGLLSIQNSNFTQNRITHEVNTNTIDIESYGGVIDVGYVPSRDDNQNHIIINETIFAHNGIDAKYNNNSENVDYSLEAQGGALNIEYHDDEFLLASIDNSIFESNSINIDTHNNDYTPVNGGAISFEFCFAKINITNTNFTKNNLYNSNNDSDSHYYAFGGAISIDNYYYSHDKQPELRIEKSNFLSNSIISPQIMYGGAVSLKLGNLILNQTNFINNELKSLQNSAQAAAVYTYNGNVTITNTNFTDNHVQATGEGSPDSGALYSESSENVTITDTNFKNNQVTYIFNQEESDAYPDLEAGAIRLWGCNATITNTNITNNKLIVYGDARKVTVTLHGGAISTSSGNLTVNNTSISGNVIKADVNTQQKSTITEYGGAIYASYSSLLNITNSNFTSNTLKDHSTNSDTTSQGGAIYVNRDSGLNLENINFINNSAQTNGSAIYRDSGTFKIKYSEFINNTPENFALSENDSIILNKSDNFIPDDNSVTLYVGNSQEGIQTYLNNNQITNYPIKQGLTQYKLIMTMKDGANYDSGQNEFTENIFYTNINHNFYLTVETRPYVQLGEEINITGYINTTQNENIADNTYLAGKTIKLYINGTLIDTTTTNNSGGFNFTYKTTVTGYQNVSVNLTGDADIPNISKSTGFAVEGEYTETEHIPTAINITAHDTIVNNQTYSFTISIKEYVNDETHYLPANITLVINNETRIEELTNGEKQIQFTPTLVGINTIVAYYTENTTHNSSMNHTNFNVSKRITQINASQDDNIKENITINYNVTDITLEKTPITEGTITVYDENNNIIKSAKFDKTTNTITITELESGQHQLTITYNGNQTHNQSTRTITVNQLPKTNININVLNNTEGNVSIEITVTNDKNETISQQEVNITLPNQTTITERTDNTGKITITDQTASTGEKTITAEIKDTEDMIGTSITQTILIEPDYQKIITDLNESLKANETALQGNITELEQAQQTITNLENNLTEALNNITELKNNITQLEQDLNNNITALQGNITELEQAQQTITNLENNLTEALNNITVLKNNISQLEQDLNNNITALQGNMTELEQAQQTITDLENNLTEALNNITVLKNNITQLEQDLNNNITALQGNITELQQAQQTITDLENNLTEAMNNITQLKNNITQLEQELNYYITALEEAQQENQELKLNLTEAQNTIEKLNNTITTLQEALKNNITALETAQKEIKNLNEELNNTHEVIRTLTNEINKLEDTIKDLEEKLNNLNKTSVITAVPENGTVDDNKVVVTLDNKLGTPIANAPITVKNSKGEIIANSTTDKNGIAVIPVNTKAGTENITITYPGNDKLTPATTTVPVTTTKNNVTVSVDPVEGIIGENITLTAYITDTKGNPVNGGNLVFKLNGKTLRTDGRFDSNQAPWKFQVKDGKVSVKITADLYLRNTKNLTASYSGSYKYEEAKSSTVTAQIKKRNAKIKVTATPKTQKQYNTIKFKATLTDTTPNHKNTTAINTNTKVLFKINGKTLKDEKGNNILVTVTNNTATYKYTVPQGMGGITKTGEIRDYDVEALLISDTYYPDMRNNTVFNVERSPITININKLTANNQNHLTVKANIKDYKGNNVIGENTIAIKINGKTYINPTTNKTQYFTATNGVIDIKIPISQNISIKKVMIVSGARQAYLGQRNETTNIIKV